MGEIQKVAQKDDERIIDGEESETTTQLSVKVVFNLNSSFISMFCIVPSEYPEA